MQNIKIYIHDNGLYSYHHDDGMITFFATPSEAKLYVFTVLKKISVCIEFESMPAGIPILMVDEPFTTKPAKFMYNEI